MNGRSEKPCSAERSTALSLGAPETMGTTTTSAGGDAADDREPGGRGRAGCVDSPGIAAVERLHDVGVELRSRRSATARAALRTRRAPGDRRARSSSRRRRRRRGRCGRGAGSRRRAAGADSPGRRAARGAARRSAGAAPRNGTLRRMRAPTRRVLLDERELLRGQRPGLAQDGVADADLADVVQQRARGAGSRARRRAARICRPMATDIGADALRVAGRVRVARVERQRQRADRADVGAAGFRPRPR